MSFIAYSRQFHARSTGPLHFMKIEMDAEKAFEKVRAGGAGYETICSVIGAINSGFRLDALTELIESRDPAISSRGVFIFEEFEPPPTRASGTPGCLAHNCAEVERQHRCMATKGLHRLLQRIQLENNEVFQRVSTHLDDLDLSVRCWAIDWVRRTNCPNIFRLANMLFGVEMTFANDPFERLCSIDVMDRKLRPFRIAVMMKSGLKAREALNSVGFEDSFTHETLQSIESGGPQRWEKMPAWKGV
jgi:hypothetical protein